MSIIKLSDFRSVLTRARGTETIIIRLDGVPVFSTPERAIEWAVSTGYTQNQSVDPKQNYHKHTFEGRDYYMPGKTHRESIGIVQSIDINKEELPLVIPQSQQPLQTDYLEDQEAPETQPDINVVSPSITPDPDSGY